MTSVNHCCWRGASGSYWQSLLLTPACSLPGRPPGQRHPLIGLAIELEGALLLAGQAQPNLQRLVEDLLAGDLLDLADVYAGPFPGEGLDLGVRRRFHPVPPWLIRTGTSSDGEPSNGSGL